MARKQVDPQPKDARPRSEKARTKIKAADTTPSPEPKGSKPSAVLIRLDEDEKTILGEATGTPVDGKKLTQSEFFTHLLQFYGKLTAREKLRIRRGGAESPVKEMTRLLGLSNAASHTFGVKRWLRSLSDHLELLRESASYPDLKFWCLYRLGYVWHANAIDLRRRGLKFLALGEKRLGETYLRDALEALRMATESSPKVRGAMRVQALFNCICHQSFAAQIRTEVAVFCDDQDTVRRLVEDSVQKFKDSALGRDTGDVKSSDKRTIAPQAPPRTAPQPAPQRHEPSKNEPDSLARFLAVWRPQPQPLDEPLGGTEDIFFPVIPHVFDEMVKLHPRLPTTELAVEHVRNASRFMRMLVRVSRKYEDTSHWLIQSFRNDQDLAFIRAITQPEDLKLAFNSYLDEMGAKSSNEQLIRVYRGLKDRQTVILNTSALSGD